MVGERPGARGRRLDRVVARGGEGPGRSLAPSPCERAGVNERAGPEGEGIRVEGHDDVGLAEVVAGLDGLTERKARAGAHEVAGRRLPLVPARLREKRVELPDLRGESRRRDRRRQQAETLAEDRPVWLSTRMPVAYPESVDAVAKKSGRPGMTSSGCLTYGTRPSRGCFTQAVRPASASEAPESSRKRRRLTPASHSEAYCGNSRPSCSANSGV